MALRHLLAEVRPCRVCGFKAINVRHETDPDNAPEGADYFRAMRDELHEYVPLEGPE
jgi:hypothetical protein